MSEIQQIGINALTLTVQAGLSEDILLDDTTFKKNITLDGRILSLRNIQ